MSEKISSSISRTGATDPGTSSVLPAGIRGIDHSAFGGVPHNIPVGISTGTPGRQQTGSVRNIRPIRPISIGGIAPPIKRRGRGPKGFLHRIILRWTNIIGLGVLFIVAILIDLLIKML